VFAAAYPEALAPLDLISPASCLHLIPPNRVFFNSVYLAEAMDLDWVLQQNITSCNVLSATQFAEASSYYLT
jgi:hypothetical protein